MEVSIIISIIITASLALERIIKHFKKSKCCNSEVEFTNENNKSTNDITTLLRK